MTVDFKPQSQRAQKNATLVDYCEWQNTSVSFESSLELSLVIILKIKFIGKQGKV